ncbi:MAG: sugar isomerase domain-containing protein, partial [Eubacteriales bacterium]
KKDDVLIIFHNIGINPATIDAACEAKKNGVKIIAVSSSLWQKEMPADHFIRHPNKKNLFDYADVCIDDFNPVGDAVVTVPGLDTPIAPVSNIIDFYIAHLLEIETVRICIERGVVPPVWSSANTPGGDEKNAAYIEKYKPRVKML